MSNKLKSIKRMTAAQIFLLGKTRLGDDILQITKITYDKHVQTEATNKINTVISYRAMVIEYDTIIALNSNPKSWTVTQLKSVLKSLKAKDYATMPSKKADLSMHVTLNGLDAHQGPSRTLRGKHRIMVRQQYIKDKLR